MSANTFASDHWNDHLIELDLPGGPETVLKGDRDFSLLKKPFADIKELVVVGYSSQGPAHAQNLRDSFKAANVETRVSVALREGSKTRQRAEQDGFTVQDGTLVTPKEGLERADFALMLISDSGMAHDGKELLSYLPKGATVGFAHGYYLGFLQNKGDTIRNDLDVIGVCPKGMGPSVRRLYTQGSGINSSAAWHSVKNKQKGIDMALAWSYGIGSPFTFATTLDNERKSDLVGERAILLGAVHGILEAAYLQKRNHLNLPAGESYKQTVESLVRGISNAISERGLKNVFEKLSDNDKEEFVRTYNAAYPGFKSITEKIYRDVSSGREVDEVYEDGLNDTPMSNVAGSEMWQAGAEVRKQEGDALKNYDYIDPQVAGLYVAGMMAQIDVLRAGGHYWSEIVNESVIEAIDSLNPFMRARGVDYMIDNCSITARRGSRKWAPIFQAWALQEVFPALNDKSQAKSIGSEPFESFMDHDAHKAFDKLSELRPPFSIAVE